MIRAVYDTNIVVSGTVTPNLSPPTQILDAAIAGHVSLVSSEILVEEYRDVLSREFAQKRLASIGKTADELIADYRHLVEIVKPAVIPSVIVSDPDDDHVLACAVGGNADYIVSGDKHLLSLGQYQSIKICNAREFLSLIDASESNLP